MKKQIIRLAMPLFVAATLTLTVTAQPGKKDKGNNGQPSQQKGNGKGQQGNKGHEKMDKDNTGQHRNQDHGKMDKNNNGQQGNSMKNKEHGNAGNNGNGNLYNNGNKNDNKEYGKKGNGHLGENAGISGKMGKMNRDYSSYGYDWNRENFKDRNKIRVKDKVTICHKFNQANEPATSITVSSNALKAHLAHGDVMGDCPAVNNKIFSDVFLRNRTDYYNRLEDTRDQVYYSQSILDYAVQRLAASRLQLSNMQNNNVAMADVQRKQAVVNNLEQNVSLLEVALNLATGYLTNRL